MSVSRVRESAPRRTRSLLVQVQSGQLPVQPGSEGRGAVGQPAVSKPSDEGPVGADANLQAATRVNPHVASSHRTPPRGGHRERRAAFLPAKAATGCPPATGTSAAPGSPASQGWHAGTVAGGNSGDPHASRPDLQPGNPAYKATTEVAGDGRWGSRRGAYERGWVRQHNAPGAKAPCFSGGCECSDRPTPVPKG
jgi:hypothetical protein